ncbi:MAG: hypothetical protein J0H87_05200 [Holosporales bacterium]|nr:hypothetical protein [Holosporales bacterium]
MLEDLVCERYKATKEVAPKDIQRQSSSWGGLSKAFRDDRTIAIIPS